MKGAHEAMARRLAAAIRSIKFEAEIVDDARIEVRHPDVERGGHLWLVAVVAVESVVPEVTYAESFYRPAIERLVKRHGGAK